MASIANVIDRIGFGPAQIQTAILAYGIWLADGFELQTVGVFTPAIAAELSLTPFQEASMSSFAYLGLFVGTCFSGYFGDRVGRRCPILMSYFGVAIFGGAAAFAQSYATMVVLRFLLGVAMSIGMPASLALVSETSPMDWRMLLMGLRGLSYHTGEVLACSLVMVDDASLGHLHWRRDMIAASVLPLVLGTFASMLLHESPLFLAHIQRRSDAVAVLDWMKSQNRREDVDTAYEIDNAQAGSEFPQTMSLKLQLATIFRHDLVQCTCVIALACYVMNVVTKGLAYAQPRVLPETGASLPAGWQQLVMSIVAIPLCLVAAILAQYFPRKISLLASYSNFGLGTFLFASMGGVSGRSLWEASAYYAGLGLPILGVSLSTLVLYQVSVEIYPARAAATGSAICLAFGRLGAISAPYMFEFTPGSWDNFYYTLALASLIMAFVIIFLPNLEQVQSRAQIEEVEETTPLLGKCV